MIGQVVDKLVPVGVGKRTDICVGVGVGAGVIAGILKLLALFGVVPQPVADAAGSLASEVGSACGVLAPAFLLARATTRLGGGCSIH